MPHYYFTAWKENFIKRKTVAKEAFNNISIAGLVRLVKRILLFTACIEIIGGLILSIRFSFDMPIERPFILDFFMPYPTSTTRASI